MIEYVQELSSAVLVKTHEGGEGKIDNKDTKTDRQQEQRLKFFGHSQVDEKEADSPHDHELVVKIEKPGLGMQDI